MGISNLPPSLFSQIGSKGPKDKQKWVLDFVDNAAAQDAAAKVLFEEVSKFVYFINDEFSRLPE